MAFVALLDEHGTDFFLEELGAGILGMHAAGGGECEQTRECSEL
jgi:hypothetical protein